jgi:DNA-directed RNA polymerase sigma subunit (sigma70/sigma32)
LAAQKAIERFREDKGAKLSSWVVTVVAGYLKCYVEAEAKRLRVPAALARDVSKFDRSVESLESSLDVSALLEILRKVLSPLSRKILLIQLAAFPRRVGKEQISEYLSVNLTAVDNLYAELRQAVMSIRRLM